MKRPVFTEMVLLLPGTGIDTILLMTARLRENMVLWERAIATAALAHDKPFGAIGSPKRQRLRRP